MNTRILASTMFGVWISAAALPAHTPGPTPPAPDQNRPAEKKAGKATDPVCGMDVDAKTAPSTKYRGKTYYFCSPDDQAKFLKSPDAYLSKKK